MDNMYLLLFPMFGLVIGIAYSMRYVISLERRTIGMEKRIMDVEALLLRKVKK